MRVLALRSPAHLGAVVRTSGTALVMVDRRSASDSAVSSVYTGCSLVTIVRAVTAVRSVSRLVSRHTHEIRGITGRRPLLLQLMPRHEY